MDTKALVEKLKGEGLPLAEDVAQKLVMVVLDWVSEEVVKSENKYDDLALAVIPAVKDLLMAQLDKIDGQEGV